MIANLLDNVNRFLLRFAIAAEQLNRNQRSARLILSILREFFPQKPPPPHRCSVELRTVDLAQIAPVKRYPCNSTLGQQDSLSTQS